MGGPHLAVPLARMRAHTWALILTMLVTHGEQQHHMMQMMLHAFLRARRLAARIAITYPS